MLSAEPEGQQHQRRGDNQDGGARPGEQQADGARRSLVRPQKDGRRRVRPGVRKQDKTCPREHEHRRHEDKECDNARSRCAVQSGVALRHRGSHCRQGTVRLSALSPEVIAHCSLTWRDNPPRPSRRAERTDSEHHQQDHGRDGQNQRNALGGIGARRASRLRWPALPLSSCTCMTAVGDMFSPVGRRSRRPLIIARTIALPADSDAAPDKTHDRARTQEGAGPPRQES